MMCTSVSETASARCTSVAQRFRHALLDLQPDHHAAAPLLQRALEEAHEVFRLFLHLDVGVADQPEGALPAHLVAGEEPRDEEPDRILQQHEAERIAISPCRGSWMKRSRLSGKRTSACIARPFVPASCSASVKPRLGMNGNGCAGSMASGVSTGKIESRKWPSSQAKVVRVERVGGDDDDAGLGKLVAQRLPVGVLLQAPAR